MPGRGGTRGPCAQHGCESDILTARAGMAALRRWPTSRAAGAMNSRRGGLRARDPSAALPLVLGDASPVRVGDVLVAHRRLAFRNRRSTAP